MDLGVGGSLEVTESLGEAGTAPSCASAVLALPQARLGVDTLPEPFLKTRTPPTPCPPPWDVPSRRNAGWRFPNAYFPASQFRKT